MKLEMNKWTLQYLRNHLAPDDTSITPVKTAFGIEVVINTDKGNGQVSIDDHCVDLLSPTPKGFTVPMQLLGFIEEVKRSKNPSSGRINFHNVDDLLLDGFELHKPGLGRTCRPNCLAEYCRRDVEVTQNFMEREIRRSLRSLTHALYHWVESGENSLTVFVVGDSHSCKFKYRQLRDMIVTLLGVSVGECLHTKTLTLPGDRRIRVITKNQLSEITEEHQVISDHTVQ